jgi:hypothetical protein
MTHDRRRLVASQLAGWLSFAAAPMFALMAAFAAIPQGGAHQMSCSPAAGMSPLCGMVAMYVLMSAFHCQPWLRLISRWRSPAHVMGNAAG